MDLVAFAIWKFQKIEGYLQGMHSFDVTTTKYIDPVTKIVSWIRYDMAREVATVEKTSHKDSFWSLDKDELVTTTVECKFSELPNRLKELGMYCAEDEFNRHHLAGPQKQE